MKNGYAKIEPFRIRTGSFLIEGSSWQELLEKLMQKNTIFQINTMDFRRGCERVKQAILGAAAAFLDAGITPDDSRTIIGYGHDGSFAENRRYFDDYTSHGRDAGRGQLFVGTLPTTPLCETAIALQMHGPVFYLDCDEEQLRQEIALCDGGVLLLRFSGNTLESHCIGKDPCGS